jgi:hypothetical protein
LSARTDQPLDVRIIAGDQKLVALRTSVQRRGTAFQMAQLAGFATVDEHQVNLRRSCLLPVGQESDLSTIGRPAGTFVFCLAVGETSHLTGFQGRTTTANALRQMSTRKRFDIFSSSGILKLLTLPARAQRGSEEPSASVSRMFEKNEVREDRRRTVRNGQANCCSILQRSSEHEHRAPKP